MENKETSLKLLRYIENIEKFEEDKKGAQQSITDTYSELKAEGFDAKTIKRIIRDRKMDKEKRAEEEYLYKTYAEAVQLELF